MSIKGYLTHGRPVSRIEDYYRDDYDILLEILSGRRKEVLVIGLRRFGKTSLLRRIKGFINKEAGYKEFLSNGLENWSREQHGNPPRKEFFDEISNMKASALYLSFLDHIKVIEKKTKDFFKEITPEFDIKDIRMEKFEDLLPPKLFILLDEFSKLAQPTEESENKRDFFLKLHDSTQDVSSSEIIFVIAEPPSMTSVFEESGKPSSTINEVADVMQNRKTLYLAGLSPLEKMNLFCLKKTKNYGANADSGKIRELLDQLSGIPQEIQIAGEEFFTHPEKKLEHIFNDIADSFGGIIKESIIKTMTRRQRAFIRSMVESENNEKGMQWATLKKNAHNIFQELEDFGLVKKDKEDCVRFSSTPLRIVLCERVENLGAIIDDDIYHKEIENLLLDDGGGKGISPSTPPWDGRIRIHHLSDMALGSMTAGFNDPQSSSLDLFSLNHKCNPFEAYLNLIKDKKYSPHILVITGDIAQSHHQYCYKALRNFLEKVLDHLQCFPQQTKVIPKKQIIIVPGEMDISSIPGDDCDRIEALETLDSCSFGDFYRTFGDYYALPSETTFRDRTEDKICIDFPIYPSIPGYTLEMHLFNSATMVWSEEANKYKANKRRINYLMDLNQALEADESNRIKEKFNQLLGDEIGFINLEHFETQPDKVVEETLRIAVTHHNLNPHKTRGKYYTIDTLNLHDVKTTLLNNGFSMILHGHQRSPIFVKETLYEKDKTRLKTLFMNGAGKFTEVRHDVDEVPGAPSFGPSFNSYIIKRIEKKEDERRKPCGDFKFESSVYTYNPSTNRFSKEPPFLNDEIFIREEAL